MNLHFFALAASMFVSFFAPLASSFVYRQNWPSVVVGLLTVLGSSIVSFVAQWVATGSDWGISDLRAALVACALSTFTAFQARARVWAETELDAKLVSIGGPKPGPGGPRFPDEDVASAV